MKITKLCSLLIGVLLVWPTFSAAYSFTFTNLNPTVIAINPFGFGGNNDVAFDILNSTGTAWTDFHMVTGPSPAGQGVAYFIPAALAGLLGTDGNTYEGPGTYTLSSSNPPSQPDIIDVIGLNIPNGSTYSFSVDIAAGEAGWAFGGNPTIGGPGPGPGPGPGVVPEPSTMLLLGSGLIGLAGYGRKKLFKK